MMRAQIALSFVTNPNPPKEFAPVTNGRLTMKRREIANASLITDVASRHANQSMSNHAGEKNKKIKVMRAIYFFEINVCFMKIVLKIQTLRIVFATCKMREATKYCS